MGIFLRVLCFFALAASLSVPQCSFPIEYRLPDASEEDVGMHAVDVRVHGTANKGPLVIGSSVLISLVNGRGEPTGEAYNTEILNPQGEFMLNLPVPRYVSIEATGYYYNEITGTLSESPITLRAFFEATESGVQEANVNVITHLSYRRVKKLLQSGADFETAVAQTEEELGMALDIGPEGFDPGIPGTGMNILGGDTDGNRYLLAVSAILVKAAELRDGPVDASLQELMNTISADLEESVELGTPIVDELRAAEAALDPVAVMAMLAARFGELGSSAEVPDIRHVIDRDNDGVVNIDDPDDTNPGI